MTSNSHSTGLEPITSHHRGNGAYMVPWQIWVVVLLLALEGIGDLLAIPQTLAALGWLLAKVLFITGLLKRWRWVYVVFLIVAALHVLAPSVIGMFAALLNLALVVLAASALRHFFPSRQIGLKAQAAE